MNKHTPGKWEYVGTGAGGWAIRDSRHHATLAVIPATILPDSPAERLYNARLIAEAPAMLAALEAFVEQAAKVQGFPAAYDPYVGAIVLARAAIRRARGEDNG